MHFSRVALALAAVLLSVDATIILGTTTGTVGLGAAYAGAALAGVAGLALGGLLVGGLAAARGKRSVAAQQQTDAVLSTVAAADAYGCALKLVCLVESKPDDQLSAEDKLILTLFGRSPAPITEEEVRSARQAYFYAAYLGASKGKDACTQIFQQCEVNYGQMMEYVRQLSQ